MSALELALGRLRVSAARVAAADVEETEARRERDDLLLAARDAGASWVEMMEAGNIAPPTLQKALLRAADRRRHLGE